MYGRGTIEQSTSETPNLLRQNRGTRGAAQVVGVGPGTGPDRPPPVVAYAIQSPPVQDALLRYHRVRFPSDARGSTLDQRRESAV